MLALTFGLLTATSCENLISLEDRFLVPKDAATSCTGHRPPARPAGLSPDGDAGTSLDLTFAVQSYEQGTKTDDDAGTPRYQTIGFDLDHSCTGEGQERPCVEPSSVINPYRDGIDGIDNATGALYWLQAPGDDPVGVSPDIVAKTLFQNAIFRVSNYSGQADDARVSVTLYAARGAPLRDDGMRGPLWDGNDQWQIMPETLAGEDAAPDVERPLYRDDAAYVVGHTLVANFPEAVWPTAIGGARLAHVRQLMVAGQLKLSGALWELKDVVVGFRIAATESLIAAASVQTSHTPLCLAPELYKAAKNVLCSLLDVASDPEAPASSVCDALSAGYRVQAGQARLGPPAQQFPDPPSCDGGVDPLTQSCGLP